MRNPFSRRSGERPFEPAPHDEVNAELEFHLEQRVSDYIARGMSPDAARQAALSRLGELGGVRSECTELLQADRRAARRRDWLGDLRQDLRYGARSLIKAPVFSLLAIVTLALGIGANAAVFGVVKTVLLDALPYAEADRLVRVYGRLIDGTQERGPLSAGTIDDIRARQRSFTSLGAFMSQTQNVVYGGDDGPRMAKWSWIEPQVLRTLGVSPVLGRFFQEDDIADTARVVVLSHDAWRRFHGEDPGILGRDVRVNGLPRTVIGVLPRGFVGLAEGEGRADFYFALSLDSWLQNPIAKRRTHTFGVVGRLKPDVGHDAAVRELAGIAADLVREYPQDNAGITVQALPVRDAMVGETRTPLLVLMASAGLVLLIACANLAGALLSRTITRRKEFAVRVALGAGRGRIVRQLLTESTILALAGGAAGVALGAMVLRWLRSTATTALPEYANLSLDPGVVALMAAVAIGTGLAFGLAPALSVGRTDPQSTLRLESRGSSESRGSRRMRGLLVAGQIALCISLLAGAGLLARSLWEMMAAPLGFNPEGILAARVNLPGSSYGTGEAISRFHLGFVERLGALPGVTGAASVSQVPTMIASRNGVVIDGAPPPPDDVQPFVLWASVSDDYFRVIGIPLRQGRTFDSRERLDGPNTMVISAAMARRFWPNGDALGGRLRMGPNPESPLWEVVGIVGDVRHDLAAADMEPVMYVSNRQVPFPFATFLLRTANDPSLLVRPVERELAAMDPALPLDRAMPLPELLGEGLAGRRLPVMLMLGFGTLALVLSSVGVYALFASMAAAREREFGVRVALGASRRGIAWLVLRQGGVWMALGLIGGAAGVVVVARAVRSLLYGVEPFDPLVLAAAVAVLLACGTLALLAPVRRATRADPIEVLR